MVELAGEFAGLLVDFCWTIGGICWTIGGICWTVGGICWSIGGNSWTLGGLAEILVKQCIGGTGCNIGGFISELSGISVV